MFFPAKKILLRITLEKEIIISCWDILMLSFIWFLFNPLRDNPTKGLSDGLFQRLFVSGNGDSAKVPGFTPPIGILQNVF